MIADKMMQSLAQTAQLTHHAECDMSRLLKRKERLAEQGMRVSVEDLVIEMVAATLVQHPGLNGTLEGRELRLSSSIHMSVAIALPGDLLVAPTIFNAHQLDASALAEARGDLVRRANANKLTVKEMTGGTFTISNLGRSRVKFFTPILNIPQVAILGIGETASQLRLGEQGTVETRPVAGLSLTFDHRAIDGGPAADFLSALCAAIETAEPQPDRPSKPVGLE